MAQRDGLAAVCGLPDDLDVGLGLEDHPEPGADECLVVDDHDTHASPLVRGCQLVLAFGQRRRPQTRGAQGWKPGLVSGDGELVDPYRTVEVLQHLRAEVVQLEVLELLLLVDEQRPRRLREQDLPAVAGVADAGGAVDGQSDVLIADERRLARVDADPDAQLHAVRPAVRGQRPLRRHRRVHGLPRPSESDEERVAVGVELPSRGFRPGGAHQLLVLAHDGAVAVAKLAQERRRAFDIREEEGHRCGCRLVHRHSVGSLARRRKPPSGLDPASSLPP